MEDQLNETSTREMSANESSFGESVIHESAIHESAIHEPHSELNIHESHSELNIHEPPLKKENFVIESCMFNRLKYFEQLYNDVKSLRTEIIRTGEINNKYFTLCNILLNEIKIYSDGAFYEINKIVKCFEDRTSMSFHEFMNKFITYIHKALLLHFPCQIESNLMILFDIISHIFRRNVNTNKNLERELNYVLKNDNNKINMILHPPIEKNIITFHYLIYILTEGILYKKIDKSLITVFSIEIVKDFIWFLRKCFYLSNCTTELLYNIQLLHDKIHFSNDKYNTNFYWAYALLHIYINDDNFCYYKKLVLSKTTNLSAFSKQKRPYAK